MTLVGTRVCSTASDAKLANSEIIDNILSMVRLKDYRKVHHSKDANSCPTMFNFADADTQGWARGWLRY